MNLSLAILSKRFWACALGILLLPAIGLAQQDPHDHLLWQISGEGLSQPSFLFGTIHIIGADDFILSESLKQSFAQTEQLALEIDMSNMAAISMAMMQKGMMPDNQTLKDLLTEEEYSSVKGFMVDSLGMNAGTLGMMERMQPMLLASAFYPKMLDSEMRSYEMSLVTMAKADSMSVMGLETMADQLGKVSQIPLEDQANMILELATDFPKEKARIQQLIDTYVAEDLDNLYKMVAEAEDMAEFREFMLDERNQNWIPVMSEQAHKMPTFFAVGAGHLWGDQGVITLLREAGFTVEPVQ